MKIVQNILKVDVGTPNGYHRDLHEVSNKDHSPPEIAQDGDNHVYICTEIFMKLVTRTTTLPKLLKMEISMSTFAELA
jgi:hypothetical protein